MDQMHDVQDRLESQISSLILATDITRQQEYLNQFKVRHIRVFRDYKLTIVNCRLMLAANAAVTYLIVSRAPP